MARLRFRQFEKELSPVEQERGLSSYPAAPPPQQMVGNEVLRETRAYASLGKSLLDFGSTLGRVITNEQGRIRKEVWEQGMPLAYQELDRELERKLIEDREQGLSPSQSEEQWKPYVDTLINSIKSTKSWDSITHEGDRKRLEDGLRARADSLGIKSLRQAYALENLLKSSMVQNQVKDALRDLYLGIESPSFNKNAEGDGKGHSINQDEFLKNHVLEPANAVIKQILEANDLSGMQEQRAILESEDSVSDLKYRSLSHHIKMKTAIASGNWEQKYNNQLQTEALKGSLVRRREVDGKISEDPRLGGDLEELLGEAVAAGVIVEDDKPAYRLRSARIIDRNDVENDKRRNPEDTYWMLRTDDWTLEEKKDFFAGHGIELDDKGEEKGEFTGFYPQALAEWNRLTKIQGGYYPSLIGAERQSQIDSALAKMREGADEDVELVNQTLKRGVQVLLDPDSDSQSVDAVSDPEYINQFENYRHFARKKWKLEQWRLIYPYARKIGLAINDIDQKSYPEIQELIKTLHPDNQDFGVPDHENFRYSEITGIYSEMTRGISKLIDLRTKDQASIGEQQAIKQEIDPWTTEGLEIMVRDQMTWKGKSADAPLPGPDELKRQVIAGETSVLSQNMRDQIGEEWENITLRGSGLDKKELLERLSAYGDYAPVVMNEFFKLDAITRADQIYTEISDPLTLNALNLSQRNAVANRKEVGVLFPSEETGVSVSYKTLREYIARDESVSALLRSFGSASLERTEILDMLADYVLYKKTVNGKLELDDAIDLSENQLFDNQYVVIQGSGSETGTTVRIPVKHFPQKDGVAVDPEVVNDALVKFTGDFIAARTDDDAWNIADLGGEETWQWRINPDETGLTLFFWNDTAGVFQQALYEEEATALTWMDLHAVYDAEEGKPMTGVLDRPWFSTDESEETLQLKEMYSQWGIPEAQVGVVVELHKKNGADAAKAYISKNFPNLRGRKVKK